MTIDDHLDPTQILIVRLLFDPHEFVTKEKRKEVPVLFAVSRQTINIEKTFDNSSLTMLQGGERRIGDDILPGHCLRAR